MRRRLFPCSGGGKGVARPLLGARSIAALLASERARCTSGSRPAVIVPGEGEAPAAEERHRPRTAARRQDPAGPRPQRRRAALPTARTSPVGSGRWSAAAPGRLPPAPGVRAATCSSLAVLLDALHDFVLGQLGQLTQQLLQRLPRGDALSDVRLRRLGHVVAGGLASDATVADIQVGAMLRSPSLAMAACRSAPTVRLGDRSEEHTSEL